MSARRIAAAALFIGAGFPCSTLAAPCAGFLDVDTSSSFCADVVWIKNRGITDGCSATLYCPTAPTSRLQMAAFLHRLAGITFLQGGNSFGAPAILGTQEGQPVEVHVGGASAMRLEATGGTPRVIGGHAVNSGGVGTFGTVIAGGGSSGSCSLPGHPSRSCAHLNTGNYAAIGGGLSNVASHDTATVAGGYLNTASGSSSTVAGGAGNLASGLRSIVAGGFSNTASADYSFAAGRRAKASTTGSFIWADSRDFDFGPSVSNFFGVRATGGVGLTVAIDGTTGAVTQFCNLLPGFVGWQCTSDRETKENFEPIAASEILERLAAMPLYTWNVRGVDSAPRMLGPTAQDFHAAFGLGNDEKTIATVNVDGVALAAIQGLNAKLEAKLEAKDRELAALSAALESLRDELSRIAEARR